MVPPEKPLIRKADFLIDIVVVGAFFVFMFFLLRSHVPSDDPKMVFLWAGLGSACMSGVFWLACWMFRVVARYQTELKNRR